jgi:hypothetical protein
VRDEEGRDGDRDHVVQELRPGGSEADELVERVAGKARRAAGLGVVHGSFRVRERGGREDEPRDHEDDRRQPEREDGGDAERVVDRRADVAVRGRKQRRRAEHALEPLLPPPAATRRHGDCRLGRSAHGRSQCIATSRGNPWFPRGPPPCPRRVVRTEGEPANRARPEWFLAAVCLPPRKARLRRRVEVVPRWVLPSRVSRLLEGSEGLPRCWRS